MTSSSDGLAGVLASMPDFSQFAFSSAGERKFHLQLLLDTKEKQLQQAGALGQRVLAQQIELEEKIRQIQEFDAERGDDEELDTEARERYRELAETIKAWDTENARLSSAFGAQLGKRHAVLSFGGKTSNASCKRPLVDYLWFSVTTAHGITGPTRPPEDDISHSLPIKDPQRDEPERSKTPASSAAQSRRAKNAAHRADDVGEHESLPHLIPPVAEAVFAEFAFEIGSGLLTEVRRLQSLLGERDKAIQDMKEEKDDLEKTVESLRTALRAQEQSSDKFKEENWNLEVTLQELRSQLSDSQSTAQRLESEHKRLTKILNTTRESADQHKNEVERVKGALDEFKAKHETEFAQARKYAAGLQRDKSDLQSALDAMKAEVAKANRRLGPKYGSPLTPGAASAQDFLTPVAPEVDDVFTTGGASTNRRKMDSSAVFQPENFEDIADISPDPSPSRPFQAANHPSKEIEDLQQRLQHAQRQIKKLTGSLHREKEMRIDYKRKLEASSGYVHDENEPPEDAMFDDDDTASIESKPKRKVTPFRSVRGRGRRGRGGGLSHRLGNAASTPSSDYAGEADLMLSPPPLYRLFLLSEGEGDEHQPDPIQSSPSPLAVPSNRTSVDGMDPFYANVLRKSASYSSLLSSSSPLRQSVLSRSARGGAPQRRWRGGAAFQETRPLSLVGQPESLSAALALEMGSGVSSVLEDEMLISEKEVAEVACQTDFDDVTFAIPSTVSSPETREAGIQVDAAPVVGTSEMSCQTDQPEGFVIERMETTTPHAVVETEISVHSVALQTSQSQVQTSPTPMGAFSRAFSPAPRRTTLTQADFSANESENDFDDGATETGVETETDAEDYHDARMSIGMTTPWESREDFHSMLTMSDNDYPESEDDESIKASRMPSRASMVSVESLTESHKSLPPVQYEEKGIEARFEDVKIVEVEVIKEVVKEVPKEVVKVKEVVKEVEVIKYIERPQAEVNEICIQTDESIPITPPVSSIPVPPVTPGKQDTSTSSGHTYCPTRSHLAWWYPHRWDCIERQSIESAMETYADDVARRPRTTSAVPSLVDKTRPPMVILPPPPRQPPPSNTMPPPSFIPERRIPTTSSASDVPPPRPSSPPPPELIQRATTPIGAMLSVHRGSYGPRQHGSSMPPPSNIRQPPSTSSFRSAANAAAHAQNSQMSSGLPSWTIAALCPRGLRCRLITTFLRTVARQSTQLEGQPDQMRDGATDPVIIHAITQTMIGEFLYKYTRRAIGKGHGEKRHKRFFWVHPYTKHLYWSSADPGSQNVSESSSKSAYIEGIRAVLDPNPMPPGLYQYSIVISTSQREMKLTAPTKERHEIWLNALKYLLSRPNPTPGASMTDPAGLSSPMSHAAELTDDDHRQIADSSPQSQRSGRSSHNEGRLANVQARLLRSTCVGQLLKARTVLHGHSNK
ncbi:coiled-coil protein [Pisolithus albus]|nr:coiled-coil protein [Pisolithus albus]